MDDEQQEKQHLANDGRQMTLIDQIIRNKVFNCRYWKEDCFGLTAVTLVDKACKLDCVGATYSGTGKPLPFLCLLMKLLQINPEKEIIIEFLKSKDYKYISALAMFYVRFTSKPKEAYPAIEQFYADFRKIRIRNLDGTFAIWHMDELAEKLLNEEIIFGISLPRFQKRWILEELGQLEPRKSVLEEELQNQEQGQVAEQQNQEKEQVQDQEQKEEGEQKRSRSRSRSRSHKKHKKHHKHHSHHRK
ncbi:unnamed protein product [Paramecium octaurelia]|uniref:Pre-mRNA-splicing factor 38 n=1 Tax=Paramecium octaurelia TaxID=43137 RepID=A0A8S1SLD0_PAROT|nr:unnamed protein product [Paramecium octaurelia]